MEISHRIVCARSVSAVQDLTNLGVRHRCVETLIAFDIRETHKSWPAVRDWIARNRAVDSVTTQFTAAEIRRADWLMLCPTWHHGYPQPREDDFGYLQETFDLSDYCPACGTGRRQSSPFMMKAEPKWGRREILQMNWVFDQFFVTPQLWARVFEPAGIPCREVLDRRRRVLQTVVQLDIREEVGIAMADYAPTPCTQCARPKFLPHCRGFFPSPTDPPSAQAVRSRQVFGSGASAHNAVLVSRQLAAKLEKVRGASLWPVASVQARSSIPMRNDQRSQ